ncbi:hypothetical protein [Streptosporangium sp. NPDC001681]|uniref:hypothetical protein n=1 Tax=Streptosporangium sp. NPDC001681 TaxID=3154395 RepID=UPI00332A7D49
MFGAFDDFLRELIGEGTVGRDFLCGRGFSGAGGCDAPQEQKREHKQRCSRPAADDRGGVQSGGESVAHGCSHRLAELAGEAFGDGRPRLPAASLTTSAGAPAGEAACTWSRYTATVTLPVAAMPKARPSS